MFRRIGIIIIVLCCSLGRLYEASGGLVFRTRVGIIVILVIIICCNIHVGKLYVAIEGRY